jgi:hypothetical protein
VLLAGLMLAGCGPRIPAGGSTGERVPPLADGSKYAAAVRTAGDLGLGVWLEADLVRRWQAGPDSLDEGVRRLTELAADRRVIGFKIADELGSGDGLNTPEAVQAFLDAASSRLRASAPGRKILVDMIVPELGCAPGAGPARDADYCANRARMRYPAITLTAVDGILASGAIDVVDLSTGLLSDAAYAGWGIDRDVAQRAAWREVQRRGWEREVALQSRKALAHPGPYLRTPEQASADAATFVDLPTEAGAAAVDVWTWQQKYKGDIVRLMDPGLTPNALWRELQDRRRKGTVMITHFTPSQVEVSVSRDLEVLAGVFRQVFIAAGTG